ncbi:MAG: protein kinase [Gemmatimonadaceae bacterium]
MSKEASRVYESPLLAAGPFAGRYKIERELGHGATSVVYLARDTVHGRDVAIKMLRRELAESLSADRFLKEIRLTATLQHPSIVPVLDSGEYRGTLYCVLAYMSGGTLRSLLARNKQLPLGDVMAIGATLARALDFAHQQNIVHRDVKPENILFAGGHPCIADFGIARAIERAAGDSTTSTGIVRGTPAYMSPEQASGQHEYDGRSDIYSLGCVLYEMIAGVPAFVGPTPQSVVAQRLAYQPRPLRVYRPRTPAGLEAALDRALAILPADRYQTAGELADALDKVRSDPLAVPPPPPPTAWRNVAVGVAVGAFALAAAAIVINRASGDGDGADGTGAAPPRIAVLPFENLGQPQDQFFADGLTDEVRTRIASMSGLSVISRTSATQYDRRQRSIAQIGRDLGVTYILTGTIRTERRPDGSGVTRVSPELVRVANDEVIWGGPQDAALVPGALFGVQSAIAESVAVALKVAIQLPERAALQARPTTSQPAYEAFLRGNVDAARWREQEPMRNAIESYERATRRDPRFALAFAKLANVQSVYYADFDRTSERQQKARAALDSAIALDSTLPATRLALGFYHYWVLRNYDSAMVHLAAARATEPNDAELLSALGVVYRSVGKRDEALDATRQAAMLDPLSERYAFDVATSAVWIGRYEEADREFQRAIALAPDYFPPYIARSYLQLLWKGDKQSFVRVISDATRHIDTTTILALLVPRFRDLMPLLDESWQMALDRFSLATAQVDSGGYYLAKGELFSRRRDRLRARAYSDSARTVLEARVRGSPGEPFFHAELAFAYAGLGRVDDAVREAELGVQLLPASRDALGNWALAFSMARVYVMAGQFDKAIDELRRELALNGPVSVPMLRVWPDFVPLHSHPRFQALLRQGR